MRGTRRTSSSSGLTLYPIVGRTGRGAMILWEY